MAQKFVIRARHETGCPLCSEPIKLGAAITPDPSGSGLYVHVRCEIAWRKDPETTKPRP
jgi:hypothetical protein